MSESRSTPPSRNTVSPAGGGEDRVVEDRVVEDRVVEVSGSLSLGQILTPSEVDLVERLDAFAARGSNGWGKSIQNALDAGLQSLGRLTLSLASYPSLKDRHVLGRKERSFDTLLRTLVEGGDHGLEWVVPTKAVLARTYGIAKVQFFTSLRYVIEACEGPESAELLERLTSAIEEAVYTRLAEELYASFVTSRTTTRHVKVLAAQQVVDVWEGRVGLATTRFCPLLRSAWVARLRAPRVFGTLLGTSEIVQLFFEDCNEEFVKFFCQHDHDSEQRLAFEEFLFDLPFESLERVRRRMREEGKPCVGPREVERYLGFGEGKLRPLVGGGKALYVSFRSRRVKAQYRASMGVPGPKRTAEAYILETLLLEEEARGARNVPAE